MLSLQAPLKIKQDKTRRSSITGQQIAMAKQQMQMETELKETIKELEKTKTALKVQAARCRKLVAAYTRQLAEREAELRSSRELKDKQLSSVLRALIELEARLKREQKSIRAQLAEKDNIINNQQLEIESLKARIEIAVVETRNQIKPTAIFVEEVEKNEPKMAMIEEEETILEDNISETFITDRECYVKPDLISSLGIEGDKRTEGENSPTPSLRSAYHHHHHHHHHPQRQVQYELTSCCPHDSLSSDTASTRSCLGDTSDSDFTAPSSSPQMKGVLSVHNRSAFSPIYKGFQKSSLEIPSTSKYTGSGAESSKNMSKSNYDDGNKTVFFSSDEGESKPDDHGIRSVKHLPSTLLQEVRIGNRTGDQDEYQDNPVLQCVNQILLKDQEDFLEEQMSLRMRGLDCGRLDPDQSEHQGWMNGDTDEVPPPEVPDETKKCRRTPSPNMKAHILHQEKSCLTMNNRLSLARRAEEKTKLDSEMKKTGSLGDHSKGGKFAAKHNPPLPPKPNRISGMKRVEFALDKRRDIKPTTVEFHNPPMVLPPPQPVCIDTTEMDIINKQPSLPLSILDPMDHGQDNELYVISNSALDDDIVQHLQGRMVNGSGLDISLGNAQRLVNDNVPHHTRTQHSNLPNGLLHPNHKTKSKGLVNNINLFTSNGLFNHQLSPNKENSSKRSRHAEGKSSGNFSAMTPPKTGLVNTIKVASPVATLLTSGKAQESPLKANQVSPSVSQIVRRFEDLGIKKLEGAQGEGYTLDNCGQVVQVDSTADKESPPIANGSAQQNYDNNSINGNPTTETANTVSYDNFLEATGLSQKSIMTPSRMLSNHKSVLKPKDVKHRNKVKSAIVEKCVPAQVVGSTIKYWTEPYL